MVACDHREWDAIVRSVCNPSPRSNSVIGALKVGFNWRKTRNGTMELLEHMSDLWGNIVFRVYLFHLISTDCFVMVFIHPRLVCTAFEWRFHFSLIWATSQSSVCLQYHIRFWFPLSELSELWSIQWITDSLGYYECWLNDCPLLPYDPTVVPLEMGFWVLRLRKWRRHTTYVDSAPAIFVQLGRFRRSNI